MADFWRIQIAVSDDVIRGYHELTPEDPKTDQTLISDWLSDLVIDARKADGEVPYPEVLGARGLQYGRDNTTDANFIFLRAERIHHDNTANTSARPDEDEPRPETD